MHLKFFLIGGILITTNRKRNVLNIVILVTFLGEKSTQSLDPTRHRVIEPNPTQPTTIAKQFDPTQSNPWIDPSTHVHICAYVR